MPPFPEQIKSPSAAPQDRLHMNHPGRLIFREKNLIAVIPSSAYKISDKACPEKILVFASNKITSSSVFLFSYRFVVTNSTSLLLYKVKGGS